ncbi:hypothetical protein MTO96_052208 [Rhipicephalus appendiculatus]
MKRATRTWRMGQRRWKLNKDIEIKREKGKKTEKLSLDADHRNAVREFYGLPHTSPVGPTLAEAGETIISLRATKLALNHLLRLKRTKGTPSRPRTTNVAAISRAVARQHSLQGLRRLSDTKLYGILYTMRAISKYKENGFTCLNLPRPRSKWRPDRAQPVANL